MQSEIVDTIPILGLQNFANYSCLNPLKIIINSNSITKTPSKYKRYKIRFITESLLFSMSVQNDIKVVSITYDCLTEAKNVPFNSKLYKTLGVV